VLQALVVDDDVFSREVVAGICSSLGMAVRQAEDGKQALSALRQAPADLVLLDLSMPELDGFGVLEALRREPVTPAPAVIIVTASADAQGRVRGTELGAIDFVEKPFRVPELQRRVKRVSAVIELERRVAEAEAELRDLRATDSATGVGSTQQLYSVLEEEFRTAERTGRPLTCVLAVDQRYGRVQSEQSREAAVARLHALAELVSQALQATDDYVFRVDAAEFVILRPGSGHAEAEALVSAILAGLAATPIIAEDLAFAVATWPHAQITHASALYRAANIALAQARSRGGGEAVYFERL
jgi:PleD family two-component response regulator